MTTESMDEYIEAIYRLGGVERTVPVLDLAQRLNVSVVSTNEMVKRLVTHGLVEYEPYRGILLTPAGSRLAMRIVRCHRLWERFLADKLNIPWDQVHEEACRLEHVTSPLVEERLSLFLGEPSSCPHGNPVPDARHRPADEGQELSLCSLAEGQQAVVTRVLVEDSALLRHIDTLGLRPDALVEVEKAEPGGGPVTLRVAGVRRVVGEEIVAAVCVQVMEPRKNTEEHESHLRGSTT